MAEDRTSEDEAEDVALMEEEAVVEDSVQRAEQIFPQPLKKLPHHS